MPMDNLDLSVSEVDGMNAAKGARNAVAHPSRYLGHWNAHRQLSPHDVATVGYDTIVVVVKMIVLV